MSVRQHLLATLILCLAITLGMTFALHMQQRHEARALTERFLQERREQLEDVVGEESETLGVFVQDYSGWDDMVAFASSLDPEWSRLNIEEIMARYRLNAVWLVTPAGEPLYAHFEGTDGFALPSGLPSLLASSGWTEELGGFYRAGERVVDLRARPVQPTADTSRLSPPVAWLLAGRVLDARFVERMERKLQARVTLYPPAPSAGERERTAPDAPDALVVRHELDALPGAVPGAGSVAEWRALFPAQSLELGEHYNNREMLVWLVAVALLLGIVGWNITRYVLRPLACIGTSLESGSAAPLVGVSRRLPEFARIADLVRESFRQREALRREMEERARLGRDLHDGVIQNLYATGMGIAHGMRMVASDPEKARVRLDETLRTLNDTMETLRGFIVRAEPEAAAEVELADACVTLFQTLRVDRDCRLDLDIAPAADAAIPAGQKATLLFIVREAISNALRHGGAGNISVALGLDQGRWVLRVRDDGRGHDFAGSRQGGRGLENIRARAADLGGAPEFSSPASGGVEVVVAWPAS